MSTEQSQTVTTPPETDDDDGDDDSSVRVSVSVYDGSQYRDTGVQLFGKTIAEVDMDAVASAIIESAVGMAAMIGPELSQALQTRLTAYGNVI